MEMEEIAKSKVFYANRDTTALINTTHQESAD